MKMFESWGKPKPPKAEEGPSEAERNEMIRAKAAAAEKRNQEQGVPPATFSAEPDPHAYEGGVAWEEQPEVKGSYGMPANPSSKGLDMKVLDEFGRDEFQQREQMAGVTDLAKGNIAEKVLTEEEMRDLARNLDIEYVFTTPTQAEIAEIERALAEVRDKNKETLPEVGRPVEVGGKVVNPDTSIWDRPEVRTPGDLRDQDKKIA